MAGYFKETASSGDFGPLMMYRGELNAAGEPVFTEVDRKEAYIVPPTGMYKLRCTGFSEPWTEENQFANPGPDGKKPEITKTHLELEITDGDGKDARFVWSFVTFKVAFGKTWSNMGAIIAAGKFNGEKPPKGEELYRDDVIGCEFMATVKASEDRDDQGQPKYAKVVGETITVASSSGADGYNPFKKKDAA